MLAKEMVERPVLRLHFAGHSTSDEDPQLASLRAQTIGAALVAICERGGDSSVRMAHRVRAKGYGESVPLSSAMRARMKLRSERRVGVHPISEVRPPLSIAQARSS